MPFAPDKNKIKFYLTIGTIVVIILIAWFLNFKKIIQSNKATTADSNNELIHSLDQFTKGFTNAKNDFQKLKKSLKQSTTSSTTILQQSEQLTPTQLKKILNNLELSSSTTATTTSQLPIETP